MGKSTIASTSALRYHQDELETGPGTVYGYVLDMIGEGKRVLEAGPATGYLTRILRERGCHVTCIEIDPEAAACAAEYCDRIIVGDIEEMNLSELLGKGQFEVAVFGDVLEHLVDPWTVLRNVAGLLKPGGYVAASLPNIAHGSIRLALMKGQFRYTDLGLLDRTHLRFFTRDTLASLFYDSGYSIEEWQYVSVNPFSTETRVVEDEFPSSFAEALRSDPESLAYQYVVKAVPVRGRSRLPPSTGGDNQPSRVVESIHFLRDEERLIELMELRAQEFDASTAALRALLHERDLDLTAALSEKEADIDEALQAREAALQGEFESKFEVSESAHRDEIGKMTTQFADARARLHDAEVRLRDASVAIQVRDATNESLSLESHALRAELWGRDEIIHSLTAQLTNQSEALDGLYAECSALREANASLQTMADAHAVLLATAGHQGFDALRALADRVAPWGSLRRRVLILPLKGLAYLRYAGLGATFSRTLKPWRWGRS